MHKKTLSSAITLLVIIALVTASSPQFGMAKEKADKAHTDRDNESLVRKSKKDKPAPVISNLTAVAKDFHKGVITWTTDIKSSSEVWYSKTSPVDTSRKPDSNHHGKKTSHKVNINKLDPNTTYYVVVGSRNGHKGNLTLSGEISFTTPSKPTPHHNPPDKLSPIISDLSSRPGSSTSTIAWMTNEAATSNIYYSTISGFDRSATSTKMILDTNLVTSHTLNLESLATSTQYYFVVESTDSAGNTATSSEHAFITTI